MAYTVGNKCAKNLCKRTVLLQLIIENVITCFFLEHSVYTNPILCMYGKNMDAIWAKYVMLDRQKINVWTTQLRGHYHYTGQRMD